MSRDISSIMRALSSRITETRTILENENEDEINVDPATLNLSRIMRSIYLSRQASNA